MPSLMRQKAFVLLVILQFLFIPVTSQAATKSIAGTTCKISGATKTVSGAKLVCTSVNKKLLWKLKPALVPTTAIDGPTWAEIDAEKAAFVGLTWIQIEAEKAAAELKVKLEAEAKAAAELKIKLEAEAKAAAELKAKLEAEAAKAAKAEAEKPKIQGLTIGNLLWADDFKGAKDSSIDSKKWSARNCHRTPVGMGGGACFDNEVVYYAPSAITLDGSDDGAAVISTTRIPASGTLPSDAGTCLSAYCAFVSGRFDTHGKVAFQYGFIEARIKMPAGSGNHPAFWMLGDNINQVGWPYSGEMDIAEIRSNEPTTTTSATHYSTVYSPNTCCYNHDYKVASLGVGADVSAGYHTYGVAWMPNSISYYVDNRLISTTTPANLGGLWAFNSKFFLILNNAVNQSFSGSWQNLQSSTMSIDWVRSYQVNGHGEVFTP
jgi:beta-glucanase (GH16 family)